MPYPGLLLIDYMHASAITTAKIFVFSILLIYLHRTIPRVEIEAVSEFLLHLLTGDVDQLPTETLVHKYWNMFADEQKQAAKYRRCMKMAGGRVVRMQSRRSRQQGSRVVTPVTDCNKIADYCGYRFGERPPERIEQCRRLLAHETNATLLGLRPEIAQQFEAYNWCFQSYRLRVDAECTEILHKAIADRRLRATKVVRATMDSMEPLLRALPTLRIIHLVRDPRAVALSRNRFNKSSRGLYTEHVRHSSASSSGVVAEASLYCNHVTADIRSRLALEREFPGRIISVRYEDVVANPEEIFRDVYDFLDEPIPIKTLLEMQKKAQKGQAMKVLTKWQDKLTYREAVTIAQQCAEFFQLLNIPAADY